MRNENAQPPEAELDAPISVASQAASHHVPAWVLESAEGSPEELSRLQKILTLVFVLLPLLGFVAAVVMLWQPGSAGSVGWPELVAFATMYALVGFGVTIGLHRLLTHRAFDAPRSVRLLLAILGSASGQGKAIKWCAMHRRHHQFADRAGDPHSPQPHGDGAWAVLRGLWHAQIGWCFDPDQPELPRLVPDLLEDRALVIVDELFLLWFSLGLFIPAVVLGLFESSWYGFFAGLIWGGLLRVFLMQHISWSINSVCHIWGARPFDSADHSCNNLPIALVSLGEGWHNNHHAFPTSARHGLNWWQFDPSYLIIKAMSQLGLARNIRVPTDAAMHAKLRRAGC